MVELEDAGCNLKFRVRDLDAKFSRAFDDVFTSAESVSSGLRRRDRERNAFAERWVDTVRRECLDRLLIVSRHLCRLTTATTPIHLGRTLSAVAIGVIEPHRRSRGSGWSGGWPGCGGRAHGRWRHLAFSSRWE
jgi:hypothetical protein